MSQIALSGVLAGRAAIAVATQPSPLIEYYLTYAEDSSVAVSISRVMALELTAEGKVVSAPVEQGSFAAYNKLQTPITIHATLGISGEYTVLQEAVDTLLELKEGTKLVNFVTPIYEYKNFTVEKLTYQQSADKGMKVLYVDVSLVEIKEVEQQYTDTAPITQKGAKKAADVSAKDVGKQQAQEPKKGTTMLYDWKGKLLKSRKTTTQSYVM